LTQRARELLRRLRFFDGGRHGLLGFSPEPSSTIRLITDRYSATALSSARLYTNHQIRLMEYAFSSRSKPVGGAIPRDTLEASEDVSCQLNNDLRICYCNPAWDRFAIANNGGSALSKFVLGSVIVDFVPPELIEFYTAAFASARDAIVEFDYECSSPDLYRTFKMQILPTERPKGYTVIHALKIEERMEGIRPALALGAKYVTDAGIITVCSHCRRSRRVDAPGQWDWVPANLKPALRNVSHGLCPICHVYFYGHMLSSKPQRHSAA
jgi:hypothetical protein